jgi:hypothetical protein
MSTRDVIDDRKRVSRSWLRGHDDCGSWYSDVTKWLFSEGQLIGCKLGGQDWFAQDKEYGNSSHSRNCNAFCSNDDGFDTTSLELSYMFAKELHRVTGAYIDAVETDDELYKLIYSTKGGA